jgi:signal transduction histidine kinase
VGGPGVSAPTLRRRLLIAFVALGVVIATGVSMAVFAAARQYQAQTEVTDRFFTAYSSAADLNQAVLDQETGFRGYALTGDQRFLDPYRAGQSRAAEITRRLDRIERNLPELRAARRTAEQRVDAWRSSVVEPSAATVRARGQLGDEELLAGKLAFDGVRVAFDDYRREILARRAASMSDLQRANVLLFVVIGLGVLVMASVAALSWLALRRWVSEPLVRFGAEVDQVERGDLAHAVTLPDAPEEIGRLAEQVDRMRVRIVQEYALAEQARRDALEARRVVEEQAQDLRRSNAELEQFAYVASHDLQEPLRKVASFCQLLERRYQGQLDERGEQYIEFAVDGAKRMQQLINDLLAFSRVGRLGTGFTDVELDDALAQASRQLEVVVAESGAKVTSDPLPTVRGESSLLVQLFQNLVGNGVKFRGQDPPLVHVGVRRDGSMWEFSCADNGIGIDPQYAEKVFVVFQRLHGRDAYGGTGIGLAMCKKIVEHHGGQMWLDTTVSDGATFRWTLPAGDETTRGTGDDDAAAQPADRGAAGRGRPG